MNAERKLTILVVEDEEAICSGICDVLAFHGYAPEGCGSGDVGLARALEGQFDLVILDIMLPEMSGLEICRHVRQQVPQQRIVMLTAKGSEDDVVVGLQAGADDYVTKPFSIRELMARVEAQLRRTLVSREQTSRFDFGPWQVDARGLTARRGDEVIYLSQREVDLLSIFVREKGRVLSRRRLLREVWGLNNVDQIETRTVDVHIAKLRKKVDIEEGSMIETVRGSGYRPRI